MTRRAITATLVSAAALLLSCGGSVVGLGRLDGGTGGAGGGAGADATGGASGSSPAGGSSASGGSSAAGAGGSAGTAGTSGNGGGTSGCSAGSVSCGGACCKGSCESGRCLQVLASGEQYPESVAVDATSVYWIDDVGPNCMLKVPLAGGSPIVVVPGDNCSGLALDSNNAYFTHDNKVMAVPLAGGSPVALAPALPMNAAGMLAIDATSVYWNNAASPEAIMKVGLAGGTPQVVAQGGAIADGFAVDGTSVYWAEFGSSLTTTVTRTPLGGGPSVELAATQGIPQTVAVDASSVYWETTSALEKVPLAGGTPTKLAPLAAQTVMWTSIAVDGHYVYYFANLDMNARQATLSKVPVGGGPPITLATGQGYGRSITVDATSVYWTVESGNGRVMKLTPK